MKNRLSVHRRNESSERKIPQEAEGNVAPKLLELLRLRVAQIRQCPISIITHQEELKARGETNKRLSQLETWATSDLFDSQERAALAFCEKITMDTATPQYEDLIQEMRNYFTKMQVVALTLAIIAVNDLNILELSS
ncbi:MAG: carboxymuconolactone decarboxylase family protein [Methylacidiphilales bacterium]|nr:carboxymuconolactone decarboxylase family protein [Candidatus Methylacidiphilales bacterium]